MKKIYAIVESLKRIVFIVLSVIMCNYATGQSGELKGKITDSETSETLIGATIMVQGTSKGTITDVDGNYSLKDLSKGNYNIVVSYVSYEQLIQRVSVNGSMVLDIKLKPSSVEMDAVKVTASKRNDTEMALISNLKVGSVVANGISKQQISRSQDKDASEVVSRVPGVTVRDGRFINVRGLDERYNVVTLNNVNAPSSESDRKAFSFDMLPASLIDNLVLYKTAQPELPADFAGAMVQIQTKNVIDKNSIDISYGTGYRYNTTFKDFYSYNGGKTDWLGFDDGTRALPAGFPQTSKGFKELADNPDDADEAKITKLGQAFGKTWTPEKRKAIPDQSLSLTFNRKFLLGKVSIGNLTSLGYSTGDQFRQVFRAGYQSYNIKFDRPDTSFRFNDDIYSTKTKLNGLFNWVVVFGNNQKIEFRNFFNQYSDKQTMQRIGRDYYGGLDKAGTELSFQSRSIYSGQLGGNFNFRDTKSQLNWTVGYSYTNKLQPDIRRLEMNRDDYTGNYLLSFNFNADPKMIGRLYLTNHENIYVGTVNYTHKITIANIHPDIRAGVLIEEKNRDFTARNIGFAMANSSRFNWSLQSQPIDSVFQDKNINFNDGIKIDESTNPTDSYTAGNHLVAGYAGIDIPAGKLRIYGGIRIEKNRQELRGLDENSQSYSVNNDFTDLFPSLNMSYNLTERSLIRFAYGRTINRPEFREISLQSYYDFEEKASIYGNPKLKNSYIQNIDLRYELFPSLNGDIITLGGFYKHFANPIEAHLKEAGSGRNYTYDNAAEAASYGLEIDMRKSFSNFESSDNLLRMLRHMVLVFNVAFIKSELHSNELNAREKVRQMQGQSPYIINTGLFYDNVNKGLMISVLYNVIGPRLMFVGDKDEPHIIQMPRNLIDVTMNKKVGKNLIFRVGIKDLFNQPVELRQNERIQLIPGVSESTAKRVQRTQVYKPSSSFTAGLTLSL
jgi:TonB-dependent receptor